MFMVLQNNVDLLFFLLSIYSTPQHKKEVLHRRFYSLLLHLGAIQIGKISDPAPNCWGQAPDTTRPAQLLTKPQGQQKGQMRTNPEQTIKHLWLKIKFGQNESSNFCWKWCFGKLKITFFLKIVIFHNNNTVFVECKLLCGPDRPP